MDIFQKVVEAIADEMDLPTDGVSILRKAAEQPADFGYLAEGLGVTAQALKDALASAKPAEHSIESFAARLGVDSAEVTRLLWANARFREDMEADSLDLVGLIMALEGLSEDEFGVALEIPDDDAQQIATVGDAVSYLTRTLTEAGVKI